MLFSKIVFGLLFAGAVAKADVVEVLSHPLAANRGEVKTVFLPVPMHARQITIKGCGSFSGATSELIVNGRSVLGMRSAYTQDEFTAYFDEAVSYVQLRVTNGDWTFTGVQVRGDKLSSPPPFPAGTQNIMSRVSRESIWYVDQLEGFTNYRDYGSYLLPIKKMAAIALAFADARGDASATARVHYIDLLNVLDRAEPYLRNTFEIDRAFELATELLTLRESIRQILN